MAVEGEVMWEVQSWLKLVWRRDGVVAGFAVVVEAVDGGLEMIVDR